MTSLKAVCALTHEEYQTNQEIYNKLLHAFKEYGKSPFSEFKRSSKYAAYNFDVVVDDEFVSLFGRELTELEVSMMVDGGFSYFGGNCDKKNDKPNHYSGEIYID